MWNSLSSRERWYPAYIDLAFSVPGIIGDLHREPDGGAVAKQVSKACGNAGDAEKIGDPYLALSSCRDDVL